MLDLTKIAQQMQGMSQHMTQEVEAAQKRIDIAETLLKAAIPNQTQLLETYETWEKRILFNPATPVEPLNTCPYIAAPPKSHTIIATDGSQIAPSAHEIAYCYLINISRIILHYNQSRRPILDSVPEIFYRPEDLYIARQWGIRTDEWMSYRRTASETIMLADIGEQIQAQYPQQKEVPTLALSDGSLTYWFLDQLPLEARNLILEPILEAWEQLRLAGIPLLSYVSASRSSESVSFLRLQACPHEEPDCMKYCPSAGTMASNGSTKKAMCQAFEPLRDTVLWSSKLSLGQRSPLWRSQARILDLYNHHQIYFCYVNVGTEIARIETPAWVAENPDLLELALGMMIAQVQKGYGYPVALAEAHNQAVVKGGDRSRFFALLEQQMIKAGLKNVGTSYKEARKRGSIA